MKKTLALLLALAMVFALCACGESAPASAGSDTPAPAASNDTPAPAAVESDEPFVINACIASEPETIDPSLISSVDGSTYTQHQFENLMKYEMVDELAGEDVNMHNTKVVLGQAKDYTVSDDMCVYTFTLRDDIFWSDGEPVTANDFVYSWQRLVDPETASDYGYFLDGIVLNAIDDSDGDFLRQAIHFESYTIRLDFHLLDLVLRNHILHALQVLHVAQHTINLRRRTGCGCDFAFVF